MKVKISQLVQKAHENAVNKGFWDKPRETGTMLALIHSEISEALEADRHGDKENFIIAQKKPPRKPCCGF